MRRVVEIFSIEVLDVGKDSLRCRIMCSAGTYIRSLAEHVASQLGTVGHVSELIRLAVGPWEFAQACDLQWLLQADLDELARCLQPLDTPHASSHRS